MLAALAWTVCVVCPQDGVSPREQWRAGLAALGRDDARHRTFGPTGPRLWATRIEPRPGLRGSVHYVHHTDGLDEPLVVELVGPSLEPLSLRVTAERWEPSHSRVEYAIGEAGFRVVERRFIATDDDVFVSELTVDGPARFAVTFRSGIADLPFGGMQRFTATELDASVDPVVGTRDGPIWLEGERPREQRGSIGRDRKAGAVGGEVLGLDWGGDRGDSAVWRGAVAVGGDHFARVRFARAAAGTARFEVRLDGSVVGELAFPSTGGWGDRSDHFAWIDVDLGRLSAGLFELEFVALEDGANLNVDGILVANGDVETPPLVMLGGLDPLRGGIALEVGMVAVGRSAVHDSRRAFRTGGRARLRTGRRRRLRADRARPRGADRRGGEGDRRRRDAPARRERCPCTSIRGSERTRRSA